MSASYTLHVAPHARPGDPRALDRASLVRDGFSWGAFLLSPLWFIAHRHWLLGVALALVLGGFWAALGASGLPFWADALVSGLLSLLLGLEASTLRRADYARQGRDAVDVVFAASEEEAETKSFARWLAPVGPSVPERPAAAPAPARQNVPSWPRGDDPGVIGMFPDLERRR